MTDYGTATDKIALLSDGLYRKYRQYIPLVDDWCWTLTPWTCNPSDSCVVRYVDSSGAVGWDDAYYGHWGARPLCYLESSIFVSVPYEDETADPRADMIEEARDAVLEVLNGYPVDVWGDAIAAAVASLFQWKQDAEDTAKEEAATRAMNLEPGATVNLTGNNTAGAEG